MGCRHRILCGPYGGTAFLPAIIIIVVVIVIVIIATLVENVRDRI
jgi:hypothetical protein